MVSAKPMYIFRELMHYLAEHRIVLPGYTLLQDTVGQALTHEQERLTTILSHYLSPADVEHPADRDRRAAAVVHRAGHPDLRDRLAAPPAVPALPPGPHRHAGPGHGGAGRIDAGRPAAAGPAPPHPTAGRACCYTALGYTARGPAGELSRVDKGGCRMTREGSCGNRL